eukprot:TRINITY_DN39397_c0_g1_i1.p1 TRINITY_DN39397_c0_g1~~TRINITY_DN39397_c0_g1_i1.p1  ORF type:complete len:550 (-),score=135.67 TRINITY_DN39397_c0_g1_i1:53-1702(-)
MSRAALIASLLLGVVVGDEYHHDWEEGEQSRNKRSTEIPEENQQYWMDVGKKELEEALLVEPNKKLAKNIILIVGDGMSLATSTAARIMKGQNEGRDGVSSKLTWEKFPHVALAKTYNVNAMVPDSAATAFAMFSGVKTDYYTMGYDASIKRGDPESMFTAQEVKTVLEWAQDEGMKTGIVTTTRVTHATPAALYARTAHRDWECDKLIPKGGPDGVRDITAQLVGSPRGQKINVILGGGRGSFTPSRKLRSSSFSTVTLDYETDNWNCSREDNKDMVKKWKKLHKNGQFVKTKSQLQNVDTEKTDHILGLFNWSHMPYDDEIKPQDDVPSLVNMTSAALDFLNKKSGDKGFFLMVEGGRIDHANHYAMATRALTETIAMDRAVEEILSKVDLDETLVIVTADHSHTLSVGGYPGRSANITGVVKGDNGWVMKADDGQPFSILGYANGPGFKKLQVKDNSNSSSWEAISRAGDLQNGETAGASFVFPGAVPTEKETHGGDDVGIWAVGPWAHLFHGVHEQTFIGHVMSLASCIGPHKDHITCGKRRRLK